MYTLRVSGSVGCGLLGLLVALSGCVQAHDVDALGDPVFAGAGGGDGPGDGDGDGDGDGPGDGDGDGDGDGPNDCNVNTCEQSDLGGQFGVMPCCTQDGKCGLDVGALFGGGATCVEADAPGTPNDNCPPFSFMGFIELPGCCRPDGTCGVQDDFLGLGCTMSPDGGNQRCRSGNGPE